MLPTPSTLANVTMCSHTLCLGRVTIKIIINRMTLIWAIIGEVHILGSYVILILILMLSKSNTKKNKSESKTRERKKETWQGDQLQLWARPRLKVSVSEEELPGGGQMLMMLLSLLSLREAARHLWKLLWWLWIWLPDNCEFIIKIMNMISHREGESSLLPTTEATYLYFKILSSPSPSNSSSPYLPNQNHKWVHQSKLESWPKWKYPYNNQYWLHMSCNRQNIKVLRSLKTWFNIIINRSTRKEPLCPQRATQEAEEVQA